MAAELALPLGCDHHGACARVQSCRGRTASRAVGLAALMRRGKSEASRQPKANLLAVTP